MSLHARITTEPLDAAALVERVAGPGAGATALFIGTVREHADGRRVRGMRYDAYPGMAERVLREIAGEALERVRGAAAPPAPAGVDETEAAAIAVEHRWGELAVGEASVVIAAAGAHRAEAFDACRYVIEEIKKRLPVWKQEHYVEGGARWLEGAVPSVEGERA